MNKTIAVIVAVLFTFALASVSFATEKKAEMAKPDENKPAEAPAQEMEKLEKPETLTEPLTPEEQKQIEDIEKVEKLKQPGELDWLGEPEKK